MVAPADVFIFIDSDLSFESVEEKFQERSSVGSGRIFTAKLSFGNADAVDSIRSEFPHASIGLVVRSEPEAIEAIEAGADDAVVLREPLDTSVITSFLERVRVRASIRGERERLTHDLAQAEKLTALGTLVAGVGHELNNPLSAITLSFDILREMMAPDFDAIQSYRGKMAQRGEAEPELDALFAKLEKSMLNAGSLLDEISSATDSVTQLVQDLRVFSRSGESEPATLFSPQSLIEQALRLVRREFGANTVIEKDYEDDLPELHLPRNRLAQVLTNLLVNAAHAMRDTEREVHRIRISARMDEHFLAISVADSGPGIPDDALERIFNPFFTTKREGQGTGLGLSISRSIIQRMGGELAVSSVYGDGATFLCFLPLPTAEEVASAQRSRLVRPETSIKGAEASVLIVDDDERVLRSAARCLQSNCKVLIARDGQEAIDLLSSGSQVDVLLTELDLPELDGMQLISWVRANCPQLSRIVVATGAQERPDYQEFLQGLNAPVIHKPLNRETLLDAILRAPEV